MRLRTLVILCMVVLAFAACETDEDTYESIMREITTGNGLAPGGEGDGPTVAFDMDVTPIPDVPFPNDLLTVKDKNTPTGRRLNISVDAATELESNMRRKLNLLDGFGSFTPIYVRFDEPLDLSTITDDNVMLVKIDSPNAGDVIPLDLGKGFTPTIWNPDHFWPYDPLADANNIVMDPANMADLDGDSNDEFVDFYEFETDTLILRPIIPMEESSRYAVVLFKEVLGIDGEPVKSPFKYINIPAQTYDLKNLPDILESKTIDLDRVAFCWSFTTQTVTLEWKRIWNGLYKGKGKLGDLARDFPPVLTPTKLGIAMDYDGNDYIMNSDWFINMLAVFLPILGEEWLLEAADFTYTDYLVFGSFESPTFFPSDDFGHPLIDDPISFDQDMLNGNKKAGKLRATWAISIPRDEDTGLDGCQTAAHPHGCKDFEEPGAKGADGGYGFKDVDDNADGYTDDEGEYMWPGSDDVADPAGDNYDPDTNPNGTEGNGALDYDFGADGQPGIAGVDDDGNTVIDDITEFGDPDSDDGLTEDANGNGRLDTPPYPVVFHGHGHTLSYVESLAFLSAVNRNGFASFSLDAFGHGPFSSFAKIDQLVKQAIEMLLGVNLEDVCYEASGPPECNGMLGLMQQIGTDLNGDKSVDWTDIEGKSFNRIVEEMTQIGFFRVISSEGRGYDVDGDTYKDSGAVFFSGNIFQTRDCVRQTAVDYMQMARIVDNFGLQSTMDINGDTVPDIDGDFNLDGKLDFGGPPSPGSLGHYYQGSSLGGIIGDMAMGVNPRISVGVPVAGAGGLADVIVRGHHRAATEPALHQTLGPVIVGRYDGIMGQVTLTFNNDSLSQNFGYLNIDSFGTVRVRNLENNTVRNVTSDNQGNFSIGIPADTGDMLLISSINGAGLESDSVLTYSKYHGLGLLRNTPDFRRYFTLAYTMLDRGDPISVARYYFSNELGEPIFPEYPEKSALIVNTTGDSSVPVASGNAIASAAGLWTVEQAQPIIDNGLNMGYIPPSGYPAPIYDAEDLDDDDTECGFPSGDPKCDPLAPDLAPLPPVPVAGGERVGAVRWPYISETGHHAFALPGSINHGIDWGIYMLNQIVYFHATDGRCVIDDPWELHSAKIIHPGPNGVLDTTPSALDTVHTVRVLKTLGLHDCDYPFPTIDVIGTGANFEIDSTPVGDDILLDYDDMYRGP